MPNSEIKASDFYTGNGEMASLIRNKDWQGHSLGPIENWPQSLITALRIIIRSSYPMFIWWGPDLIMFHNDAYLPVLGKKHPRALGRSAREMWAEIWDDIGEMAEQVMEGHDFYKEDLPLYLERRGFPEETYWTFSYSPITKANGEVGGLFCACNEETDKVLQQRRLRTIMDISAISTHEICVILFLQHTIEVLKKNPHDVPFAAIYVFDDTGRTATLYASCGLKDPHIVFDETIDVNETSPLGWNFKSIQLDKDLVMRKGLLKDFETKFKDLDIEVDQAAITPIAKAGENKVAGILICGISPYLSFDKNYSDFFKLAATNISRGKADIRAHEIALERNRVLAEADKAKTNYLKNLQQSQNRLESMIMQSPVGMAILKDENFVCEVINKSFLEIIGKSSWDLLHKSLFDAYPEIKNQEILNILNTVLKDGTPFTASEYPAIVKRNGIIEKAYFNFALEPMREMGGDISGILVIAIDESAQVEARKVLEKREEYFRNMANDVPLMIWMTDISGACTYVNKKWLDYTGQTFEEGLQSGWMEAIHPEDREETERIFWEAIGHGKKFELTYRLRDKDGVYHWHMDAGMPRFDQQGNLEGFTGAVVNIHERKEAEDALKQSENELRSAISATNLGTWMHYPLSGEINFSARSKELFGLSPDSDIDFATFKKGLHPKDREETLKTLQEAIASKADKTCVMEYRTIGLEDGKLRWLKASGQPYFDKEGDIEVFIGTLLDITERKVLEKQKDDFLAIASHELKTPVTSIKGYIQMIAEEFEDKNELESVGQLNIVDRQVDKLIGLINELLDASKIEAGEIQMNKTLFDFDQLINEVVQSMQFLAAGHKLLISGNTGKFVLGDRNRIEQVFINLISNAIKFSPGEDKINIHTGVENGFIRLSVQDFGVGIKKSNLNKIFDRFYRDEETSQWSSGLGLGLFISSDIIRRHNGSMNVESELGHGTTFYVELPYKN